MISRLFCSAVALALAAGVSSASVILETEPNDFPENANFVGTFSPPGGSVVVDGIITPGGVGNPLAGTQGVTLGDVDWFTFTVEGDFSFVGISVFAFDLTNNTLGGGGFEYADSAIELLNANGEVIAWDDDSGPGLNPSLGIFLKGGTYTLGIAPYEDLSFPDPSLRGDGPGPVVFPDLFNGYNEFDDRPTEANFAYKIIIGANVAPAPGAATLLGLSGLVALRRRR